MHSRLVCKDPGSQFVDNQTINLYSFWVLRLTLIHNNKPWYISNIQSLKKLPIRSVVCFGYTGNVDDKQLYHGKWCFFLIIHKQKRQGANIVNCCTREYKFVQYGNLLALFSMCLITSSVWSTADYSKGTRNYSQLWTLLFSTIIHYMLRKFIQGCKNVSTLFALKLIVCFLLLNSWKIQCFVGYGC